MWRDVWLLYQRALGCVEGVSLFVKVHVEGRLQSYVKAGVAVACATVMEVNSHVSSLL